MNPKKELLGAYGYSYQGTCLSKSLERKNDAGVPY